jgi:UTP--glucose-1-phosphate uridylyltransferase
MIDCYNEYQTTILGVQEVPDSEVNKYGIINAKPIEENVYKIKDMIEKPNLNEAPSNIAILGRYILTPTIFNILETQQPGKGGEIQLTDALRTLVKSEALYAYIFEGKRYDVGDKLGFLEATVDYALKNPELKDKFIEIIKQKI